MIAGIRFICQLALHLHRLGLVNAQVRRLLQFLGPPVDVTLNNLLMSLRSSHRGGSVLSKDLLDLTLVLLNLLEDSFGVLILSDLL